MALPTVIRFLFLLHCRFSLANSKWVDLTHNFETGMATWQGMVPFNLTVSFNGSWNRVPHVLWFNMKLSEHIGTHIDAPIHFAKGRSTVDEIPLENLVGEAIVVNISAKVAKDRNYQLSVADLQEWEEKNGRIPDGGILLVLTGFGKYWGDDEKYMGTNTGNSSFYSFPGIHPEAAQWLVDNRKIHGVGLDSRSLDQGKTTEYMSHRILLGNDIYGLESVANIEKLPTRGSRLYVMPMKIKGGSGGPTRIVANLDKVTGSSSKNGASLVSFLLIWFAAMSLM